MRPPLPRTLRGPHPTSRTTTPRAGTKKWALIATKIKTKGSKQCRRRWKNFLNMNAKTCSWSPEEDEQLVSLHRIHGNKWTEIYKDFGDR